MLNHFAEGKKSPGSNHMCVCCPKSCTIHYQVWFTNQISMIAPKIAILSKTDEIVRKCSNLHFVWKWLFKDVGCGLDLEIIWNCLWAEFCMRELFVKQWGPHYNFAGVQWSGALCTAGIQHRNTTNTPTLAQPTHQHRHNQHRNTTIIETKPTHQKWHNQHRNTKHNQHY